MQTNAYLLPARFKVIGWILAIPSALGLVCYLFSNPWDAAPPAPFRFFHALWARVLDLFAGGSVVAAVGMVLLMIGLLFIAFSKEKIEDEYITKLRGDSLIWAVIANAVLMAVLSVLIYGGWFLYVAFFNLYTVLILFIVKFHFALNRFSKESGYEE